MEEMEEIIEKVQKLISENESEWKERYSGYLEDIFEHFDKKIQKGFHTPRNLTTYTTVSQRNKLEYDLRFKGQSVGKVSRNSQDKIILKPAENNNKFVGYTAEKIGEAIDWHSDEARAFRRYFKDIDKKNRDEAYNEHRVECALLKEFSKGSREDKALRNIQPVRLQGCFFQMPTPIKASDHDNGPSYAGENSGGVDIISRVITKDGKRRLCVMELKKENKKQKDAMKQAVAYAVFICELLKKEDSPWWDFFSGHSKNKGNSGLDKKNIDVVTIMPEGQSEEFANETLTVGTITLHCHSLYFDMNHFKECESFTFTGTYPNTLKK